MVRRPEQDNWQQQRWAPHHQSWSAVQPTFAMEPSYNTAMTPLIAPPYSVPHTFVYGQYGTPETANSVVSPTKQEITANAVDGRAPDTMFATGIDRLMKIIQQKQDGPDGDTPATQPKPRARENNNSGGASASRKRSKTNASTVESTDKPHACHRTKCHKRFSQITHLHIHDRAHTGERPHKCTFAGCDKRFTQKGNLRTHERRHLGERPFKCHIPGCTRAFPQKGNLAAHLETHYKRHTFRCILKSCGKTFSSRGNLKTHQNNYHKEELRDLELKFSNMRSITEMTEADRELWDYFLTVHKNSNKGIKGRGKECRVELLPHSSNVSNQYPLQSPVELQHTQFPVQHGLPNSMSFGHHFSMPRNNLGQDFLVSRGGPGYDVYEMDQASMSSGTITPASSPGGLYDDHHRGLSYPRMY
ncbi:putative C2H2 transcription factor [Rosellinia necatrix]|uniref:Putative C2H2 transcription factor n=1 Tax=Rosellinia necatrix TaxID=77044 RepID=A0A1W2TLB1_ROSNE|nr:putative C2H2 transcription factor [Rosellinia necatrix]